MKLILAATEPALASAWEKEFRGVRDVEIHRGSILEVQADAVVSPANSYGFMDGGIDAVYSDAFGPDVERRLRRMILDRHHGELLIGSAEIVETGHDRYPYLISAPTMRVPMILGRDSINPFLATRAALLLVRHGVFHREPQKGANVRDHVQTIAFPGMGTGVGQIPFALCARQMRAAFDRARSGKLGMPSSWAEATEEHRLLHIARCSG